jgi:hypothetical protein
MDEFTFWLQAGLEHITDPGGADHLLFLVVLCAPWHPTAWRHLLLLATAFTVGHSLSLALAVLGVVQANSYVIELLIPITILTSAVMNLATGTRSKAVARSILLLGYGIAGGFGLIHGLGFSGYLTELLGPSEVAWPLLAFNLGLEAGQLLIVAVAVALCWVALKAGLAHRWWNWGVSAAAVVLSLVSLLQRI